MDSAFQDRARHGQRRPRRDDPARRLGDEPRHPGPPRRRPRARRVASSPPTTRSTPSPATSRSAASTSSRIAAAGRDRPAASSSAPCGSPPRSSAWATSPSTSPSRPGCATRGSSIPPELRGTFAEMGGLAEAIVSKTGSVIATQDVTLAADIARHDEEVDRLHRELFTDRPVALVGARRRGGHRRDPAVPLLRALRRPRRVRHASASSPSSPASRTWASTLT